MISCNDQKVLYIAKVMVSVHQEVICESLGHASVVNID